MHANLKIIAYITCLLLCSIACKTDETVAQNPKPKEEPVIISIESDWFDVSYLRSQSYIIEEPKSAQGNVSYLIIGTDKAIMFDTGTGENEPVNGSKIKYILEQLTSLPITLLLSHFHFDHTQNIAEFDKLGFPDLPSLRQAVNSDDQYSFTSEDLFLGNYPAEVQVDEWLPVGTDIDLGNRIIQLISIPGHTDESIAIIDKTYKNIFLGDYLYNGALFLFAQDDLLKYQESINFLIANLDPEYKMFGAHGKPEIAYERLQKLKAFLQCISDELCESSTTTVWGQTVHAYEYEDLRILIFQ